jgi:hypothetical protein
MAIIPFRSRYFCGCGRGGRNRGMLSKAQFAEDYGVVQARPNASVDEREIPRFA